MTWKAFNEIGLFYLHRVEDHPVLNLPRHSWQTHFLYLFVSFFFFFFFLFFSFLNVFIAE